MQINVMLSLRQNNYHANLKTHTLELIYFRTINTSLGSTMVVNYTFWDEFDREQLPRKQYGRKPPQISKSWP